MSRSHAARMPAHFDNYKHLTVGDVLPDATSRLYKRLITRARQKYIPVRDISKDKSGRELSSYLIHPDFIDKSVLASQEITDHLEPRPNIQVIQYSKLTSMRPTHRPITAVLPTDVFIAAGTVLTGWIEQASQFIRAAYGRVKAIKIPRPAIEIYSMSKGLKSRQYVSKRTLAKVGVIALLLTGGVFAYSNLFNKAGTPSAVGGIDYVSQPSTSTSSNPGQSSSTPTSSGSSAAVKPFNATSMPTAAPVTSSQPTKSTPTPASSTPSATQSQTSTPRTTPIISTPVPTPTLIQQPVPTPQLPVTPAPAADPGLVEGLGGTIDGVVNEATNTVNDTVNGVLDSGL